MSKYLYCGATLIAILAGAGWVTGQEVLASWVATDATMKPTTVILGILVGVISYTGNRAAGVALTCGAILTLVVGPVIPDFGDSGLMSEAPGVPSNMTLFLYAMIGMDMVWTRARGADPLSKWTAIIALLISSLCLIVGYGMDVADFRYSGGGGLGTEMAIPTAVMFMLFSVGRIADEPAQ